jgi:hypothetical protein
VINIFNLIINNFSCIVIIHHNHYNLILPSKFNLWNSLLCSSGCEFCQSGWDFDYLKGREGKREDAWEEGFPPLVPLFLVLVLSFNFPLLIDLKLDSYQIHKLTPSSSNPTPERRFSETHFSGEITKVNLYGSS